MERKIISMIEFKLFKGPKMLDAIFYSSPLVVFKTPFIRSRCARPMKTVSPPSEFIPAERESLSTKTKPNPSTNISKSYNSNLSESNQNLWPSDNADLTMIVYNGRLNNSSKKYSHTTLT